MNGWGVYRLYFGIVKIVVDILNFEPGSVGVFLNFSKEQYHFSEHLPQTYQQSIRPLSILWFNHSLYLLVRVIKGIW